MNAVTAPAGGMLRPLTMTGVRREETAASRAAGDADFDALYRAQSRRVLQTCRYLLGSPDEAEDAAQEVFLRARQRFEQYDRERPFSSWILGVASHHCIDRLRRRGRETRLFGAADIEWVPAAAREPGPLTALLARERGRQLREAVAALPDKYRVPLVLAYFHELAYAEIGAILGIEPGHVAVLVFRGRKQLRRMLTAPDRKDDDVS
ncbi:MAG: sigma-70 family RNA polymerase sigma factor [Acidobacteria bacterium]|nr:sigma-70 family RNA polymerase sigma factor [Acidobacteriota bacterium]